MGAALPRRIWIVGPSGAGKSTLAAILAERLGVPAIHLDDIHWQPGWIELPKAALVERVGALVAGDAWVVDGNYSYVRNAHCARAELFVWLDAPFLTAFVRVLRRTFSRARTGELCCNGNTESLANAFFSRDSVLWWAISRHGRTRRRLAESMADKPHVRLRSQREVDAFLARGP